MKFPSLVVPEVVILLGNYSIYSTHDGPVHQYTKKINDIGFEHDVWGPQANYSHFH